jgi:hypothetical protein
MGFFSKRPLFEPGKLLVSPGVIHSGVDYRRYMRRHLLGDWGDVSAYDKQENRRAVGTNAAVLSQYSVALPGGDTTNLVIMTEAGRIHTVIFLLDEEIHHHELH